MKCTRCGGEAVAIGGGQFRCRYCRNIQSGVEAAPVQKTQPTQAATVGVSTVSHKDEGADLYEKIIDGVLEIRCKFPKCLSSGSGLLIDRERGYALTNTHVVTNECKRPTEISVNIAGETVSAEIVLLGDDRGGEGDGIDLALIKLSRVPARATAIKFGDYSGVRIGERVYVVGNSLGYGTCITSGIVSDKNRIVDGERHIMTDCAVNSGNSGGPLFNADAEAIGVIVSGILSAEGMNFAIPADMAIEFVRRVLPRF